ncbi:MAG: hypothetical protein ACPLZG_11355 [Thermoproteota archaeon]
MNKVFIVINVSLILISTICLILQYKEWYSEVYSIMTFNVRLESLKLNYTNSWPVLELRVTLSTVDSKRVRVLLVSYSIYKDGKLIRQVADNYPFGLEIEGNKTVLKNIELPKDVQSTYFEQGRCYIELQINIKTRFGLVPIKYTLKNLNKTDSYFSSIKAYMLLS